MIRLDHLQRQLKRRLKKLEKGGALEVLTYKRNRGFMIVKEASNRFRVREHGYQLEVYEPVTMRGLEKLLPRIIKREFPRSTNVRLFTHDPEPTKELLKELGLDDDGDSSQGL